MTESVPLRRPDVRQERVDLRPQHVGFPAQGAGRALWMLRAISRVAAPCSSTAAAIAVVTSLISPIVLLMLRIADTAEVVTVCMLTIC